MTSEAQILGQAVFLITAVDSAAYNCGMTEDMNATDHATLEVVASAAVSKLIEFFKISMEQVRNQALERAATTIELYDDATMKDDYMLDTSECAEIIRALKTEESA